MKENNLTSYIIGFLSSIVLTLAAFLVVTRPGLFGMDNAEILATILALAVLQLIIQMLFFLHLGSETGSRWKLAVFFTTIVLVLIVVVGSLWIMEHLNYNMTPAQMNQYMQDQQGF